ncbi:MAG: hypothetical protein GY737_17750 [Desulfobacteraceae bacterium]|nr:hypothetical protein [Desulfobacteraceae bacterium]
MKDLKTLIQHVAPTLSSALEGPFAGVATKFITDRLVEDSASGSGGDEENIIELLKDTKNLQKVKDIDQQFKLEMKQLGVDVFSLETDAGKNAQSRSKQKLTPQITMSVFFLLAYFTLLGAIFFVEVSDSLNMTTGENSLMDELQIFFGVLTAGVGQILSFWFGGVLGKSTSTATVKEGI